MAFRILGGRFDPMIGMRQLAERVGRVGRDLWHPEHWGRSAAYPAVNIREVSDAFLLEAELPGIKVSDLELSVRHDELVLKGQRKEPDAQDRTYHRRERGVGSFVRTLTLPGPIDADKVEAKFADGVLLVRLPKSAQAMPKKIVVRSGN